MLSAGTWSDDLIIDVDYDGVSDNKSFNLTINDVATGTIETFDDVTMDKTKSNFVETVVNDKDSGSEFVVEATRQHAAAIVPLPQASPASDIDSSSTSRTMMITRLRSSSTILCRTSSLPL